MMPVEAEQSEGHEGFVAPRRLVSQLLRPDPLSPTCNRLVTSFIKRLRHVKWFPGKPRSLAFSRFGCVNLAICHDVHDVHRGDDSE